MAQPEPDPYASLGVAPGATAREIRAAYQALVQKFHPDLHQGNPLEELASARLVEINRAYHILSDPGRRAAHDAGVRADGRSGGGSSPAGDLRAQRLNKRLVLGLTLLGLIPLAIRLGGVAVRGLAFLTRAAFEAASGLPGGVPAVAAALGLLVLAVVWVKRRRR